MTRIDADWLGLPATQRVFSLLLDAGYSAFAVGGCVRNSLLQVPVNDIDFATNARPEEVLALARETGLKAIGTGIEHGTVTVMADDTAFEVTTFRKDVETDGRRAVVAFSQNIEDDARRRDFTMNALYSDASGTIHDPLDGLRDLSDRRVRFIENPKDRIREDYLRSLRYFRFHAWYGDPVEGFDPDALDAISRNVGGLASLSKERVGAELKRLLKAQNPAPALAGMRTTGVLAAILPGATDVALGPLIHLEESLGAAPDAIRRLAALGGEDAKEHLRLSRKEIDRLDILRRPIDLPPAEIGYRLGEANARDAYLVSWASTGAPVDATALAGLKRGARMKFPVKAADLMPDLDGPALGRALADLEQRWIDSDFALTRDDLLAARG